MSKPKALIFGSIGTLVETSELQREAFNAAFREAGLDWDWDREAYRSMLKQSGGRKRIAQYARERGVSVDADALHARKTELFDARIREHGLDLRAGVAEILSDQSLRDQLKYYGEDMDELEVVAAEAAENSADDAADAGEEATNEQE